jgi:hypothetical protein
MVSGNSRVFRCHDYVPVVLFCGLNGFGEVTNTAVGYFEAVNSDSFRLIFMWKPTVLTKEVPRSVSQFLRVVYPNHPSYVRKGDPRNWLLHA